MVATEDQDLVRDERLVPVRERGAQRGDDTKLLSVVRCPSVDGVTAARSDAGPHGSPRPVGVPGLRPPHDSVLSFVISGSFRVFNSPNIGQAERGLCWFQHGKAPATATSVTADARTIEHDSVVMSASAHERWPTCCAAGATTARGRMKCSSGWPGATMVESS
jgi:hypothetical protein